MEFFKFDEFVWERLLSLLQYNASSPMTLASGFFLFAFLIFGIGYMAVRRRRTLRTAYIILASFYLYYKVSGLYLLLLLAVAVMDYLIGGRIAHRKSLGKSATAWVALSTTINVAILVYFKTAGLFAAVITDWDTFASPWMQAGPCTTASPKTWAFWQILASPPTSAKPEIFA